MSMMLWTRYSSYNAVYSVVCCPQDVSVTSGAFGILVICRGDRSRDIDMSHVKHSFGDGPTVVSSAYQLHAASYYFRPKGFNAYTYPIRGPLDASVDGNARF